MDTTKQWFNYLYLERNLSTKVIGEARLSIKNNRLSIPILDKDGIILFRKYRKEPWDTSNSPKYVYEKGGTVSLYGVHFTSRSERLFITEGELDTLALLSCDYDAVSSTGGTLSWQEEWKLDRIPTIIFDNDEAGIKGTIRTALIIGKCIISWVPAGFGKDVSDVLQHKGKEFLQKLIADPVRQIKLDLTEIKTKKHIIAKKKELQVIIKEMEESVGKEIMRGLYKKMIELEKAYVKHKPQTYPDDPSYTYNLEKAKEYPIEHLLTVIRKMAKCPFHADGKENTASFHIMGNNKGFCFGGCDDRKPKDAVDIYMHLHHCDHITAVKTLSNSL